MEVILNYIKFFNHSRVETHPVKHKCSFRILIWNFFNCNPEKFEK